MKASKASVVSPWIQAAGFFVAIVAVFIVYGPALNGPFLLDDTYLPYLLPAYANAPLRAWLQGMRPMLMLTYWLNFKGSGTEPGSYHLVNVFLHILNGGLVFAVLRKLLVLAKGDAPILAAFGAGLFLLHPLQTESVSYVASRSETLSLLFFLFAFVLFLYRKDPQISWRDSVIILILFGFACLSKEHAAVLPILLLLTDYYWNPGFTLEGIRGNWRLYLPMAAGGVLAIAFVWRVLSTATTAGFGMKDLTWYQYFFTQCRAIWRYLLLFVFPLGQNVDHDYAISHDLLDRGAIVGLIGLLLLIAAAWYYRRRFPIASYGVFTALILFSPTSSVVPIRDTLVERRMYLPFIGLLLIALGALQLWKVSRPTLIGTLGLILLVEATLAYDRNRLWGNSVDMWQDSVSKAPVKVRPNFQLAYAYYNDGKCQEAADQFAKTAALEKPSYGLLVDWALAADCAGRPAEAIARLQQAASLDGTGHIYSQIGMEYAKMAQYAQALDALDRAVKIDPNFGRTYVYRGNVYALQGNKTRAEEEYRHALQLDASDQYARDGLNKLSHQ